jgi:hypothetical protein
MQNKLIEKEWKIINSGEKLNGYHVPDDTIATVDDEEVLGASEGLIVDREILEYIVNLHNLKIGCLRIEWT